MSENNYNHRVLPEYRSIFRGEVSGPYVVATYYIYSKDLAVETVGRRMSATLSCGLGVHSDYLVTGLNYLEHYSPKVIPGFTMSKNEGYVKLVIPLTQFIYREQFIDIPQMLNFLFGDFFEEQEITRIKLVDLDFSPDAIDLFPGPTVGVEGIRKLLGTYKNHRPHIAIVPQPPLGMNAQDYAALCYKIAKAGADHIVDSDVLVDPRDCSVFDRANLVIDAIEKAQNEKGGQPVLYSINITCGPDRIVEMAENVIEASGGSKYLALAICPANTGLSALRILSSYVKKLCIPLHAHVTGLPLMTRNRLYGISYKAFNILVRLLGADIVHAGSLTGRYLLVLEDLPRPSMPVIGPMVYSAPLPSQTYMETIYAKALAESTRYARENNDVLTYKIFRGLSGRRIKSSFQLIAGGINPTNVEYNVRLLGKDVILLAGAGLFSEPPPSKGSYLFIQSAVKSLRQVIDILLNNENIGDVVADESRRSTFKDLFNYIGRHDTEFDKWDWRKQPLDIRLLDRLSPAISSS